MFKVRIKAVIYEYISILNTCYKFPSPINECNIRQLHNAALKPIMSLFISQIADSKLLNTPIPINILPFGISRPGRSDGQWTAGYVGPRDGLGIEELLNEPFLTSWPNWKPNSKWLCRRCRLTHLQVRHVLITACRKLQITEFSDNSMAQYSYHISWKLVTFIPKLKRGNRKHGNFKTPNFHMLGTKIR